MTDDLKPEAGAARDGSKPASPAAEGDEVAAHRDAAFYHESAAFHHRQAAHHLALGQAADAERHVWAAFGHSLNAHESTRTGVSALRGQGPAAGPGRFGGPPAPDGPPLRPGPH